jgi:protein-S-isoprenylcysteine O-methyltransferase Ste14
VLPGGDVLRYAGLVILSLGALLRVWPMMTLGRRFASVVAIQEGHKLHTSGVYRWARHPSYVGILLMDVGFACVFRSSVAVLLLPLVFWMFHRRMDVEEALLVDAFGEEYRDYMGRSARLLPGVY